MNTESSQSIPSFIPLRKTRESVASSRFQLEWSYGPVNRHVQNAIFRYLITQPGIISVDFPGNTSRLDVKYDPVLVSQDEILQFLECPQIQIKEVITN